MGKISTSKSELFLWRQTTVILLLLIGGIATSCKPRPHVQWTAYSPETMEKALHSGKPVLADFYAAWCGPCMDMKETTFTDPRVIEALEPFERIRFDMSFKHAAKVEKIADEFNIQGLPTLIFFNPKGNPEIRLSGYQSPEELLQIIETFCQKYHIIRHPLQMAESQKEK